MKKRLMPWDIKVYNEQNIINLKQKTWIRKRTYKAQD